MNISKSCKIEACCADPKMHRAQFEHPFIDGQNIVATDGRVMVIVPCAKSESDADAVRVPVEALKASRKLPDGSIKCGPVFALSNGATFPAVTMEAPLPNYKAAIPAAPATFAVMLNADSLARVCAGMGCDQVVLEFTGASGEAAPVRVIPTKGNALGYMMTGKRST